MVATAFVLFDLVLLLPDSAAGPIQDDPTNKDLNWLAICPGEWITEVTALRDFRSIQGYTAGIWTLAELDASYGDHSPQSIKQALLEARNTWTILPRWVCLVGDHEKDGGPTDILSDWTKENPELGGEVFGWGTQIRGVWPYTDIDDDGVGDLYVGRIPASSGSDVDNYVSKVIAHDSDPDPTYGEKSTYFLYDYSSGGDDSTWTRELGDSLFSTWLPSPNKTALRASSLACCYDTWEAAAIAEWDAGPGLVLAFGSKSGWWDLVNFFHICAGLNYWTINELSPTSGVYPVLLALSCGTTGTDWGHGACSGPGCWTCGRRPVAEQLLLSKSDRGASAVLGFTRNTKQMANFLLGKHLLLQKSFHARTWGEAFTNALNNCLQEDPTMGDHVFQATFEGDPAVHVFSSQVTGIDADPQIIPRLRVPNPVRALSRQSIEFWLPDESEVRLTLYDVRGAHIHELMSGLCNPGWNSIVWDGRDEFDKALPQGVYFLQLRAERDGVVTRKMVSLK